MLIEIRELFDRVRGCFAYDMYIDGVKTKYKSISYSNVCPFGKCIGQWMQDNLADELKKLDSGMFYGLSFYEPKKYHRKWSENCTLHVCGDCGLTAMELILNAIGYDLKHLEGRGSKAFSFELTKKEDTK